MGRDGYSTVGKGTMVRRRGEWTVPDTVVAAYMQHRDKGHELGWNEVGRTYSTVYSTEMQYIYIYIYI